jgi:phosphoglycerate dehydrogenase-like enzyme
VADRAIGFGLRILVHDPIAPEPAIVEKYPQVQFVGFEDLLETSDFISIHAPNIPSTKNLINANTLAKMKPGSYLINTSRGALINEADLIRSLTSGHLGGAAIDVYCQEPLPADHALRTTPRLLLTPHNAFNSREAAERMSWGCAQPIIDLLDRKVPEFICNRNVLQSESSRVKQLLSAN